MVNDNPVDYKTPNSLAAIWSMMLPGLGQMMKGMPIAGIIWCVLTGCGYFSFFWPGLTIHILCVLDAALYKGEGSFIGVSTWPQRFAFLLLIAAIIGYLVLRNDIGP